MKRQRGFSLVEVLIALLVTMFGVLGMVGLQGTALSNTEQGRYNGLAAIEASSLVTAMKSNVLYWGTPPGSVAVTPAANSPAIVIASTQIDASKTDCIASTCTPTQMAYYDLNTVGTDVANRLPSGQIAITCAPVAGSCASPPVYTITIYWSEKNVAIHNATGSETGALASATSTQHSYQTMVTVL